MTYEILDRDKLPAYLAGLPTVVEVLGDCSTLQIDEIGDGNLNFVFRVSQAADKGRSVIVKQAVPYLRMAGDSWPLSRDRMTFEIRALRIYNDIVPSFVPKIYHADEEMSVVVMQTLMDHQVVRGQMIDGIRYANIGKDIGIFLAQTLFQTSSLGMGSLERRQLMDKFTLNSELCKLTEDFIFTFPYIDDPSNYSETGSTRYAQETLRRDGDYKRRVLRFKELFLTKTDALLHADLHTGSLMANHDETYVIDTEFAFFGPFGFDVGKIIANFLLSYTSHYYHKGGADYQRWLLNEAFNIWTVFEEEFLTLWAARESGDDDGDAALLSDGFLSDADLAAYKTEFMRRILQDAVGFCACSLARRTLGIAGVIDVRGIEDVETRTQLEIHNLKLSHLLLMEYDRIEDISQFRAMVENFYANTTLEPLGKWT
ncbi:MAG: S-methyl-5-thioribose kinase [Pseudomonadota bacterium]